MRSETWFAIQYSITGQKGPWFNWNTDKFDTLEEARTELKLLTGFTHSYRIAKKTLSEEVVWYPL